MTLLDLVRTRCSAAAYYCSRTINQLPYSLEVSQIALPVLSSMANISTILGKVTLGAIVGGATAQKNLRESMHFIDKSDTPAEQFADDSRAGISPEKSEILLSQELF